MVNVDHGVRDGDALSRLLEANRRLTEARGERTPTKEEALNAIDAIRHAKAARLIRSLENSKASYRSMEMRLRRWTQNRTVTGYLLKVNDKDPLLAKMLRAAVVGGATYATLRWLNGTDPIIVQTVVGKMLPDFLQKAAESTPQLLPAIGAAAVGFHGTISKWTLESAIQIPRLIDNLRYKWELRKVNNKAWFGANVARIAHSPFFNYGDLHKYCASVVKEVHPAKQTEAMEKAVESTKQLDFWAKDLAIRICEAVANSPTPMHLREATRVALERAPWATKTLTGLEVISKAETSPTAFGQFEFKPTFAPKSDFVRSLRMTDVDEVSAEPMNNAGIRQRIAGLSARFENMMNRSDVPANLMSGNGAAAAVTATAMGGMAMLVAGAPDTTTKAVATFLSNYMAAAPTLLTGALTLQAPLRLAQMFDNVALLTYKARNILELDRLRTKDENWKDDATQKPLTELREFTAQRLDRWHELRGVDKAEYATTETAQLARDLMVEKLLLAALQYKLEQPRLNLDELIIGLVEQRGFERESKPLQSLEKPSAGDAIPIRVRSPSKEQVLHYIVTNEVPDKPVTKSNSSLSL